MLNYIATRENVEIADDTSIFLPTTQSQQEIIENILKDIPDSKNMFEYDDYLKNPIRKNATEFISNALENNFDLLEKRRNYMEYISNRPRVEKVGTNGLFTEAGVPIVLSKVADEVANHKGNIYSIIISIKREDAERLGYDNVLNWQALLRSKSLGIANALKMKPENLKWYAAFHNEAHHPHVHMVVYSENPSECYLTNKGIDSIRSEIAKTIFRQDLNELYIKQTDVRNELKKQGQQKILEILKRIENRTFSNPKLEIMMLELSRVLDNCKGKLQYGFMPTETKKLIDNIVDELSNDSDIADLFEQWCDLKTNILKTYKDDPPVQKELSKQQEFQSIKNDIIRAVLNLKDISNESVSNQPLTSENGKVTQNNYSKKYIPKTDISMASLSLLQHLAQIISNNYNHQWKSRSLRTDKKLISQIAEKKQALGIKDEQKM
jgi:hypothetical protein